MAVTGTKKEATSGGYQKTYGLAAYEVLGVNLSNKELKELGFWVKEGEEEIEEGFTGEEDGNQKVTIEFACKSLAGKLRKFSFYLVNKNDRNNPESTSGDLYTFINDQGANAWSTKPNEFVPLSTQYAKSFTGVDDSLNPRPAKKGEKQLMLFMRSCMAINYKEGGTIKYNIKKLFNGNFGELKDDLKTDFLTTILVATTIAVKETDEGSKETESFYRNGFAPGILYEHVVNKGEYTIADIKLIRDNITNNKGKTGRNRKFITALEYLLVDMTKEKHGCKDLYYLGVVKDYDPKTHIEMSNEAIIVEKEEPAIIKKPTPVGNTSKY